MTESGEWTKNNSQRNISTLAMMLQCEPEQCSTKNT